VIVAIDHERVSVGTEATVLGNADRDRDGFTVNVQNPTGSGATVFVGGADVTTADYGYSLAAGSEVAVELLKGEALYGIVASGTLTVNVLRIGV
jgi:hypothetical protein